MRGAPLFSLRSAVGRLTRRSFLTRLGATAVALTLARHLPGIAPTPLTLTPPNGVYAGASFQRGDVFTIEGRYAFDVRAILTNATTVTVNRITGTNASHPNWQVMEFF